MTRMLALIATVALLVGACSDGAHEHDGMDTAEMDHTGMDHGDTASATDMVGDVGAITLPSGLSLTNGYIMAPLKGRDVAAGYFTASNTGEPLAIVAASTPVADTVELHTHLMEDGVMKMREVSRVELATDAAVVFEPGGYHLMMFGFARAEGQVETPVTLELASGETLTLTLPIRERG